MKRKVVCGIFLLFALVIMRAYSQKAEYNKGNNWLYSGGQKFIGMDIFNSDKAVIMNNGIVWYSGDLTNDGVVGFDNSIALDPAQSMFAGDALQHISGAGTTRFYNVLFGSQFTPVAYRLEQNITVTRQADFSSGILLALQTTPETMMNIVQFENGATCINASHKSHVDGFVSKTGNTSFMFPVGNGGFYRPVSISAPSAVTDCFAARYLYANPDNAGYIRTQKVPALAHVSDKEYWVVNRTNGTSNGKLTLSWDVSKTSAPVPDNLNALVVARWDGGKWVNEGNISTTGDRTAGTITANVTGYGVFTLATMGVNMPVVANDTISTYENTDVSATVLANDSVFDGTALSLTTFSINGKTYQPGTTVLIPNAGTITLGSDGVFTYLPELNYNGVLPTITYTVSDGGSRSGTGELIIKVLPMPNFVKRASKPTMNNDGSFSWTYMLTVLNDTPSKIDNVQVEDNLDDVFNVKNCSFTVTEISATGSLTANGLYNGSSNIKTLLDGSSLMPGQMDSVRIELKVNTNGQADSVLVFNQAVLTAKTSFGEISLKSRADMITVKPNATQTVIPVARIILPDGFSPNGDGINDKFVVMHPVTSKMEIEVYSRSGAIVYKSSDYANDWDGTGLGNFLGRDLIDGTYFCSYREISISTGELINKGVKFITIRR